MKAVIGFFDMKLECSPNKREIWLRNKCIFLLGCYCGLRACEIASLDLSDLRGKNLHLQKKNVKGKTRGRILPMNDVLIKALNEYKAFMGMNNSLRANTYLFPSRKKGVAHITTKLIDDVIKQAYSFAGIPDDNHGTHSMRKTFAKEALKSLNNDIFSLSRLLGHSNIQTTTAYLRADNEAIRLALDKMFAMNKVVCSTDSTVQMSESPTQAD